MSMTHEEARRFIQFRADDALKEVDHHLLDTHLNSCLECQKYADTIKDLKSTLQPLLHRKWDQAPLPLPTRQSASGRTIKLPEYILFATRMVAMGIICIAFLFNIWHFTQSGRQGTSQSPAEIPLIPTPSMYSTSTQVTDQGCEPLLYQVRENDTLDSVAGQFSISPDEIIRENHLRKLTLDTSMKLTIPVCSSTPSGTPNTVTTTFTPLLGSTTLTPVNGPTQ